MKLQLLSAMLVFSLSHTCLAQSTIITPGTSQPNITANSTKNGVVFPRMKTTEKESITSLSSGTIVYDTDLNCLSLYTGNGWICLNTPSSSLGPSFQNFQLTMNPSGNAPLAGKISVTSNQSIKLSYTVKGQDGEDFTFSNDKFSSHNDTTINLFGLYPSYTNSILVTIINPGGFIAQRNIYVKTDTIPSVLPQSDEIIVNSKSPNILTKFILFFPNKTKGVANYGTDNGGYYPTIIDTYGKIRGYITKSTNLMIPLTNGNWLRPDGNSFEEFDLLGNVIRTFPHLPFPWHHDVTQMPNGNLLYLGDSHLNNTIEDKIYTVDFNTGLVIDSLNLFTILDPLRAQLPVGPSNDWFHANSLTYDAVDDAIIVSGRQQSAIVKIKLATKQLKWIISDSTNWNPTLKPYILTPTGLNFEQQYGQHSAILKPNDNHTLLFFDNGNDRSYTNPILPINNYSRAVEFSIDETNKTVVQNFAFGKEYGSELFTPYISNVQYLNNDHIFVNYGGILKDINNNASNISPNARGQVRIFEIDKNKNVYFDISIKNPNTSDPLLIGFRSYRAFSFNFK